MTARSEEEAAYFTLLRAREEHETLLRYRDYLAAETERLDGVLTALDEAAEVLPRKVRRPVDATRGALAEAIGRRRGVVLDELARSDDRITAAAEFVTECEEDHARLRS